VRQCSSVCGITWWWCKDWGDTTILFILFEFGVSLHMLGEAMPPRFVAEPSERGKRNSLSARRILSAWWIRLRRSSATKLAENRDGYAWGSAVETKFVTPHKRCEWELVAQRLSYGKSDPEHYCTASGLLCRTDINQKVLIKSARARVDVCATGLSHEHLRLGAP